MTAGATSTVRDQATAIIQRWSGKFRSTFLREVNFADLASGDSIASGEFDEFNVEFFKVKVGDDVEIYVNNELVSRLYDHRVSFVKLQVARFFDEEEENVEDEDEIERVERMRQQFYDEVDALAKELHRKVSTYDQSLAWNAALLVMVADPKHAYILQQIDEVFMHTEMDKVGSIRDVYGFIELYSLDDHRCTVEVTSSTVNLLVEKIEPTVPASPWIINDAGRTSPQFYAFAISAVSGLTLEPVRRFQSLAGDAVSVALWEWVFSNGGF